MKNAVADDIGFISSGRSNKFFAREKTNAWIEMEAIYFCTRELEREKHYSRNVLCETEREKKKNIVVWASYMFAICLYSEQSMWVFYHRLSVQHFVRHVFVIMCVNINYKRPFGPFSVPLVMNCRCYFVYLQADATRSLCISSGRSGSVLSSSYIACNWYHISGPTA